MTTTDPTAPGAYVIIRSTNAGVFAGTIHSYKAGSVVLTDARRIWYWDGAASLSELALTGPKRPQNCKFPPVVPLQLVNEVIEVIPTTPKAREAIEAVSPWVA